MSLIIFGNGPLPAEPRFSITAPGSRTWQIVRMAAHTVAGAGKADQRIIVLGLDESDDSPRPPLRLSQLGQQACNLEYHPLPYAKFVELASGKSSEVVLPDEISAVVGTGSVQPYATAAQFARARQVPLWIDVFGDPISEIQSRAEVLGDALPADDAETHMVHVWKLLMDALLQGDRFSALSERQRYALLGQLGCAGRLNQFTAETNLVEAIPYGILPDELPPMEEPAAQPENDNFELLWCGSFNTWMDVPTFTRGVIGALSANPAIRLTVLGGQIPAYNEVSYQQFLSAIKQAGLEGAITLLNWQPLEAIQKLYQRAHLGLSIDRYTYEAELGSRTRLVNFLAAGVPVASTVVTELSCELRDAGLLLPFEVGNADSLTQTLLAAAADKARLLSLRRQAQAHMRSQYDALKMGRRFSNWILRPSLTADKQIEDAKATNQLLKHQRNLRATLGA